MPDRRTIEELGRVKFKGRPSDSKNLSAVGVVGDLLVVAGDEDDRLQVLRRRGDHYELLPGREILLNDSGEEADVEGIAVDGDTVYAVGSHSRQRPKPKAGASRAENRARLAMLKPFSPARHVLVRFRLAADGSHRDLAAATLGPAIEADDILRPFAQVPCKENGVDIEGLAVRDGRLRVGFRGPVLQRGFVPVLTCDFADPVASAEARFVNLGGRGIRDIERIDGGFLILAGPVSDAPVSFQLYAWDGGDCLPGTDVAPGRLQLLGEVPTPPGAKAEGLAVEKETERHYTALVLFDGLEEGGAARLRVAKQPGR